jgi:hypothetical protein
VNQRGYSKPDTEESFLFVSKRVKNVSSISSAHFKNAFFIYIFGCISWMSLDSSVGIDWLDDRMIGIRDPEGVMTSSLNHQV